MFLKILNAYKELGYNIHIGNNKRFWTAINGFSSGFGISITDIAFFQGLKTVFLPERILCIGNAFGYSAFCLAEIFPGVPIDCIDAEIEGSDNQLGSQITRTISSRHYNDQVQVKKGFSPQDLSLFSGNKYDFIFIDAMHDNEHLIADFNGVQPFTKESCVIYLHDVGMCSMIPAWNQIKDQYGFKGYNVDFTNFGCKAQVRGIQTVHDWFQYLDSSPIEEYKNPDARLGT